MAVTPGGAVSYTNAGEYGAAVLTRRDEGHPFFRRDARRADGVKDVFTKQFDVDFVHAHAEDRYADVVEPEQKCHIIGTVTYEKLSILKETDVIVHEELDACNARIFEEAGDRNDEHSTPTPSSCAPLKAPTL